MISLEVLQTACFELLTSSGASRYYRKACELSMEAELMKKPTRQLLTRLLVLVDSITTKNMRTPDEVEAALILADLVSRGEPEVVAFTTAFKAYGKLYPTLRPLVALILEHERTTS